MPTASGATAKKAAKPAPKKAKTPTTTTKKKAVAPVVSLAAFCKASKTWLDWETVTLPTGTIDEKWLNDTIAYYVPVTQSAPRKSKVRLARSVLHSFRIARPWSTRRSAGPGSTSVCRSLSIRPRDYTDPNSSTIAYATQMSDYLAAKCGLDFQAPWKALNEPTG